MAPGKHSKVDGRKSTNNYCSTVTLVAFVALCLVGVWMMTSSSVVPLQSLGTTQNNKNEVRTVITKSYDTEDSNDENSSNDDGTSTPDNSNSKQFEDNPGDLPEDATKGDSSSQQDKSNPVNNSKEDTEIHQEEKVTNSEDASTTKTANENEKGDAESKPEDGELKDEETRGDGDRNNSGGQENHEEGKEEKEVKQDREDKVDAPSIETLPAGAQSELLSETSVQNGSFSTQATESKNEKEGHKSPEPEKNNGYHWKLCNVTAGSDFIPCLDNLQAIKSLRSTKHYEHRERHCPENPPTCLVPLPEGYQRPIEWPTSREKIWYHNVPHTKLAELKGHQNWVKVTGEFLTFPGGGTQFKHGALHYIDFIQEIVPEIGWGKRSRVILDVGCGVASFGGFLFDRDVLTMSLAPKDEHEAQVQFALERGIPALSAVMGTQRLPFPGRVFDIVHCARCRVPWHIEGGKLLLELNRLLRPGGFFVWSATPIYQKLPEDVGIWEAMTKLTKSMCWEVKGVGKDKINKVGVAVYQKPMSNECYEGRSQNEPPLCKESDDPNAAWKVPLQACMHEVPVAAPVRGSRWPEQWPSRVEKSPYWLLSSQVGVYGKAAPEDFTADFEHWKRVVTKSYMNGLGINWSTVRNVMDMRAIYGGFAAALKDKNIWVMNVVSVDSPDTLPIIYERGLFGIYHDWCESFSTYPRSYDLLHADHLFSKIKNKCNMTALVAEVDRILRPEGNLIVRDTVETINEVENMLRSMNWEVRLTYSKDKEGLLCVQKSMWRPVEVETIPYAVG
ncbi:probable methyltransferase PMT26 isoform X1 [Cynara cardunculus var. scolymus]|uniref:probable methyltransferase PMT26 isoform X1 n=1 Tax=Cynara cardunculus var. scolymus TaxID=59895 RepID=UPI000D62B89D|nr:probable methyltransferase PMT26 isoform X1 [Cynara cardunculus var. scolymus]XP_024959366.1 probable methyltransferase PMT26 isoform X1 [Cynara cardunculus var. scolymus]